MIKALLPSCCKSLGSAVLLVFALFSGWLPSRHKMLPAAAGFLVHNSLWHISLPFLGSLWVNLNPMPLI